MLHRADDFDRTPPESLPMPHTWLLARFDTATGIQEEGNFLLYACTHFLHKHLNPFFPGAAGKALGWWRSLLDAETTYPSSDPSCLIEIDQDRSNGYRVWHPLNEATLFIQRDYTVCSDVCTCPLGLGFQLEILSQTTYEAVSVERQNSS